MRTFIAPLLALLLLAACGSSSSGGSGGGTSGGGTSGGGGGSTAAPQPDPCSLVTQQQAGSALGEAVDPGKSQTSPIADCFFPATNGASLTDSVDVQVHDASQFDIGKTAGGSYYSVEPLSGVGDDAYYEVPLQSGTAIDIAVMVKKGAWSYYIAMHHKGFSDAQVKDALKQLALIAAAH